MVVCAFVRLSSIQTSLAHLIEIDYIVDIPSSQWIDESDQVVIVTVLCLWTRRSDNAVAVLHVEREDRVGP